MTRNSPTLDAEMEEGFIEISREDAERLNVKHGETVTVSSRRGSIETKALVTRRIESGLRLHAVSLHRELCKYPHQPGP